jgi:hypothetical protein
MQAALAQRGPAQSVTFAGVEATGADLYDVTFEHGARRLGVLIGSNARIDAVRLINTP